MVRVPGVLRRPVVRDAALPLALVILGALELALMQPRGWGWGIGLEAVSCALLALRRRYPLVACPAAAVVVLLMPWFGPQLDEASTPILIAAVVAYSLARWPAGHRGLIGLAVVVAMVTFDYVAVDARSHDISDLVFVSALLLPPYVLGRITRRLTAQSELLERNQELVRREAIRDERDRIARELHDVIAHSVSAMVVQTAAAQDLLRTDPDRAAEVLEDVATTGRRALSETGRLLHVIRDDADELGLAPAPGLADLPALVDRFRADGLDVRVEGVGALPTLPSGVDVSAYRIVQEALTNALRYAPDRTVALRVAADGALLSITTSNRSDGRTGQGSGLGLLGVGERVKVLGGSLTHSNRDGRFELVATLPAEAQ